MRTTNFGFGRELEDIRCFLGDKSQKLEMSERVTMLLNEPLEVFFERCKKGEFKIKRK